MSDINLKNVLVTAATAAVTQVAQDAGNKLTAKDAPAIANAVKDVIANQPAVKEAQAQYNYATNNETLLTSYSFTGGLTAMLGAVGTFAERLSDGYQPVVDNPALIPAAVTFIGAVVVLYGRLFANKPIGS